MTSYWSLVILWRTLNMWISVLYINMHFWFSSSKSKIQPNFSTLLRLCHLISFLNENDCFYKLCQSFSYTKVKTPKVFFSCWRIINLLRKFLLPCWLCVHLSFFVPYNLQIFVKLFCFDRGFESCNGQSGCPNKYLWSNSHYI